MNKINSETEELFMEAVKRFDSGVRVTAWVTALRPAFHSVGVFPYTLGALIAYREMGHFDWSLWLLGVTAVMLIMGATHLLGECFDYQEDTIAWSGAPSRFAGGAGVVPRKMISRRSAFYGGVLCAVLAVTVGLIIWVGFDTGPWTIPLGALGIIGGVFYSAPPFRWVSTGMGEMWILVCYGFLAVAAGVYLPLGRLTPLSLLVSAPIATTIFNVIFANEYPDYDSDRQAQKKNLLSRVGREKGIWIYSFFSLTGNFFFFVSVIAGVPIEALFFYALPFALSVYCVRGFFRGDWRERSRLEIVCGMTIVVNLATTFSYIAVLAFY